VKQGLVELARVTRWKVLQQHLDANANIFTKRVWIAGRVSACTSQLLELELRSPLDGPTWVIPGRSYQPPEFPFVSF
jgi:hypothetical protein